MKIQVDVTLSDVIEQSVQQDGLDATIQEIIRWCGETTADMDGIRKVKDALDHFVKMNE